MLPDVKETKAAIYDLLSELNHYEACEMLFEGIDEKYRQKKMAEHSWNFREKLHDLTLKVQNKGNSREYPLPLNLKN